MNYPGLENLRADVAALSNANVWLRRLCAGSTPCFLKPTAKPWCWTKPFRTD